MVLAETRTALAFADVPPYGPGDAWKFNARSDIARMRKSLVSKMDGFANCRRSMNRATNDARIPTDVLPFLKSSCYCRDHLQSCARVRTWASAGSQFSPVYHAAPTVPRITQPRCEARHARLQAGGWWIMMRAGVKLTAGANIHTDLGEANTCVECGYLRRQEHQSSDLLQRG